jgi:ATP-dependent Clp protease ATP-binding subunit ClpC
VDYGVVAFYVVLFLLLLAFYSRKEIRARWQRRRAKAATASGAADLGKLADRLHELEKTFGPFGSNAAHPSALLSRLDFIEATQRLAAPAVPINIVLQYVEGNSWALSSAALAALRKRADASAAIGQVLTQCEFYSPWAMYFALEFLAEANPRPPAGAPAAYAKEWWVDNRWMPNVFRDYFAGCAARGEVATFGDALRAPRTSSRQFIRRFLSNVTHPVAATLIKELDDTAPPALDVKPNPVHATLNAVGRYWSAPQAADALVEPQGWREVLALAEATLSQLPPRSLLISGEPFVGKTSFLRLLAQRLAADDWTVFEAGGADLQADQVYIGELEGRIRKVIEELANGHKLIWYIPDILQMATSGRHHGQSASILDQIIPAIAAGRLIVWCEASAKGTARLVQLKPSLRGLFETVTLEPLSPEDTLSLARDVLAELDDRAHIRFEPDCAQIALDTASQYLGNSGLPGSVLFMLKLTAMRTETTGDTIPARRVLETLSQVSGLPLSMLDTREQLDLKSVRDFFTARVIGQDEAVEAIVERVAMLKAGLNDPDKPIAVFLFAGPTGTGKTELAKAASEFLFGSVERMIRLDMSEFQSFESLNKILGQNSASAVESDSLISRVRKQPFSVILLDEFEKSHPNIWDLFLQAFDEGRLTDAMGQEADFRHCLFILTSNLGATAHRTLGLGFAPQVDEFTKEQVLRAISQTYRPEFQNRLDKIIVFRPLTRDLMRSILKKELAALLDRRGLKDRAWAIEWESSALEFLLEKGFSPEMGARPLKRAIDQYLVAPLAAIIVEKRFPEGEQFLFVRSDGNGIQAEFVDPDADTANAGLNAGSEQPSKSELASVILAPKGTREEFQRLQADYDDVAHTLQSPEWDALKNQLNAVMAAADFWSRPDRFGTLARLALMDRVKLASETAGTLKSRLTRSAQSPRGYSAELSGRLALQLHVVKDGMQDAFADSPIELALAVEPVFNNAAEHAQALAWGRRLMAMYRAWAGKRRMQFHDVSARDNEPPTIVISGFGAYRTLAPEAGLHVFEQSEGPVGRVTARVRLAPVPLGDVPASKERALILKALTAAPKTNAVVRRYREEPPLVRDAAGSWRTGRLDLVLGGDFDLLQNVQKQ